jgi:hypothetical protein
MVDEESASSECQAQPISTQIPSSFNGKEYTEQYWQLLAGRSQIMASMAVMTGSAGGYGRCCVEEGQALRCKKFVWQERHLTHKRYPMTVDRTSNSKYSGTRTTRLKVISRRLPSSCLGSVFS